MLPPNTNLVVPAVLRLVSQRGVGVTDQHDELLLEPSTGFRGVEHSLGTNAVLVEALSGFVGGTVGFSGGLGPNESVDVGKGSVLEESGAAVIVDEGVCQFLVAFVFRRQRWIGTYAPKPAPRTLHQPPCSR